MIKIIIGFVALLILLAASYIIFVDQNQGTSKELKEHFYQAAPGEVGNVCSQFNENPKTVIEDNSNFVGIFSEPDDTSEKMKNRYNQMYSQCFIANNNTNDPNNCRSVEIGEIPTPYNDEFGQKIINCISNESCDVAEVDSQCVQKGEDCSIYDGNQSECESDEKPYCKYENGSCRFRANLCSNYNQSDCESAEDDGYCIYYDDWGYCGQNSCFINENQESCLSNGCVWDGYYCSDFNCSNVSVDDCLSNDRCALKPLDQSEAKCVPK